jgi:D-alanyl-D-alanine carboxypeptidase
VRESTPIERQHRIHGDGPRPAAHDFVHAHRRFLRTFAPLIFASVLSPLGCSGEHDESVPDHHDDGSDEPAGSVSSPLAATDSVATAVAQSCTTTAVKGLSTQLVGEIQCLRPGTFMRIDATPGLALGSAVFPYLQTNAAKNLVAAQKARGTTMSINSALRTLPQQYLLYRWYQTGRCGIGLAASPGTSNHEGAIAVDINDNAGWRAAMLGKGFRWLGASDPVHYDFIGGGTVDLRGISVKAFQRLWNRNNPTDLIAEDGSYGAATATRLAKSPSGGFAKGADCSKATPDGGADGGADAGDEEAPAAVPAVPDATEPASETPPPTQETTGSLQHYTPEPVAGCTAAPAPAAWSTRAIAFGLGSILVLVLARRRGRRS